MILRSDVWSTKWLNEGPMLTCHPMYLNGIFYVVADYKLYFLLVINMAKRTMQKCQFSHNGVRFQFTSLYLVFHSKLYMVTIEFGNPLIVLEVDLEGDYYLRWQELMVLSPKAGPSGSMNRCNL